MVIVDEVDCLQAVISKQRNENIMIPCKSNLILNETA